MKKMNFSKLNVQGCVRLSEKEKKQVMGGAGELVACPCVKHAELMPKELCDYYCYLFYS